jgi:methionyl-tRNA formyltransferase
VAAQRPLRLVLFADPTLASSVSLLGASLRTAAEREDVEVAAVVDTARRAQPPMRLLRALAAWGVRGMFNPSTAGGPARGPLLSNCASLARRYGIPVLAPREAGVNDPSFVAAIERLAPDATVAFMVSQIFREPLLRACGLPVNYRDGLLPHYRGVAATEWSIYEGASRSGFSFHRMIEQVDHGPILLQDSVPLGAASMAIQVQGAKTRVAGSKLDELFDLLVSSSEPLPQSGPGSAFTHADLHAIRAIDEPDRLTVNELELRVRAFGRIDLTLTGKPWATTALRRIARRPRHRRLAFTTADGVWVEPSRVLHLPPALYGALAAGVGLGILGSELWPS